MIVSLLRLLARYHWWCTFFQGKKHYVLALYDCGHQAAGSFYYPATEAGQLAVQRDFKETIRKGGFNYDAILVWAMRPGKEPRLIARRIGLSREGYRYGPYTRPAKLPGVLVNHRASDAHQTAVHQPLRVTRLPIPDKTQPSQRTREFKVTGM